MGSKPPIHLGHDREPWDRQAGESNRQYSRFLVFRDLGRMRTLKQAVEMLHGIGDNSVQYRTLMQYAYEYRWTERAEAHDRQQDQAEAAKLRVLHAEMNARHRRLASGLMAKGVAALQALDVSAMTPMDIVRFLKYGADIETRALGQPTQVVQHQGPNGGPVQVDDMSHLSPQERAARLTAISAELARRAASSAVTDDDE
jgi:hypothetical protein